jgi:hypothetical protein
MWPPNGDGRRSQVHPPKNFVKKETEIEKGDIPNINIKN